MSEEVKRPSALAGMIDGFKGVALTTAERFPAAEAALEPSVSQHQGNAELLRLLFVLQLDANKPVAAAGTLGVIAQKHPDEVEIVKVDQVRALNRMLRADKSAAGKTASDEMHILLAEAGWRQKPMTPEGQWIREEAIERLVERGSIEETRKLLTKAPLSAEAAAGLAIDKRYQPLWLNLEGAVHDRFQTMIAEDLSRSAEAAAKAPTDLKLLTQYMEDLRRARQPQKAATAARALVSDRDGILAAGSDGFWLVNEYALALFDSGQSDAALAQMDWLLSLDMDKYPELISEAIDRAEMLEDAGRPADALAAFTALDAKKDSASAYGKMWIWAGTSVRRTNSANPSWCRRPWRSSGRRG